MTARGLGVSRIGRLRCSVVWAGALAFFLQLQPAASGTENRAHHELGDPQQRGLAQLYGPWPMIAADYVTAMMRYHNAATQESLPPRIYPFVLRDRPPFGGPWTWTAANGSHARRLSDGSLHLSLTHQLGNWFVEISCLDAGWPVFSCSDGIERVASAPDPRLLVIDGIEFSRALPARTSPETPDP